MGFCSQECYENGANSLLIKDVDFDSMNYQQLRNQVKKTPSLRNEIIASIKNHLAASIKNKTFPHLHSQKEELVDR